MQSHSITIFGPASKILYLEMLRKTGKRALAAQAVAVSQRIINEHLKNDPEFAAQHETVLELRAAEIVHRIETEAIEGILEPMYDKKGHPIMVEDGNGKLVPAYRRRVETALRRMVLARYDEAYRERVDHNHNHKGGVLVMPMPAPSIADWEAIAQSRPKELGQ